MGIKDYTNDYGDSVIATVELVKKYMEILGMAGQKEILHYLEEVFVLGSFVTEVKENRFSRAKVCPHCGQE
ncbi:hypothetical protein [Clostridium kluyveri]|uniref:hypothetical protein n=1 Tax=Clostridium kluyveri TaxID=1534 RepID=UPI0022451475|nr:hypothetical protein [Clostridium kluyveri]UZQ52018.1 hypothetical protein OP486_07610 [Clostridium kluyveri]